MITDLILLMNAAGAMVVSEVEAVNVTSVVVDDSPSTTTRVPSGNHHTHLHPGSNLELFHMHNNLNNSACLIHLARTPLLQPGQIRPSKTHKVYLAPDQIRHTRLLTLQQISSKLSTPCLYSSRIPLSTWTPGPLPP